MKIEASPNFLPVSAQAATAAGASSRHPDPELRKVCERFEGLFLAQLFRVMRESIPESGLWSSGPWQGMFDLFFDQAIGEKAAERNSYGIAEMLERQLGRVLLSTSVGSGSSSSSGQEFPLVEGAPGSGSVVKSSEQAVDIVSAAAGAEGVDPHLVQAVIDVESGGDPRAVSKKGAVGLMQLMPDTAREVGVRNPWDPVENVRGGVRYLRQLLDTFGNDLALALAAYNAGPGAVRRHGGIPPFRETRQYVEKVLNRYHQLKRLAATTTKPSVTG
ncbi:MAG: transglycosylase SLT domain-containing protein [candidate division KSB1 bacterium]|nr:transglycosylase SLT domain-containing protein [candidate division KSB1 bacterium]